MINCKILSLFFLSALFIMNSCTKQQPVASQVVEKNPNSLSFVFFNVTINTNSEYTFSLPELTQSILDSGTISVYYRSVLVVEDSWYPLPYFPNYRGNNAFLAVAELQLGQATLKNYGLKATPRDFRFDFSVAN